MVLKNLACCSYVISLKSSIALEKCYGPSVISATVTTGGHPSSSGLYETSETIGRGVTESRKKFNTWKRRNVKTRRTDILTYQRT